jgi:hypothetical protein
MNTSDQSQHLYDLYRTGAGTPFELAELAAEVSRGLRLIPGRPPQELLLSKHELSQGWQPIHLDPGAVVINESLAQLLDGDTCSPIVLGDFKLDETISRYAGDLLAARLKGARVTNDPVVSLHSFSSTDGYTPSAVRGAQYVDTIVTNGLGNNRLYRRDKLLIDGATLWLTHDDTVLALRDTLSANQFGGSLIALTADDHVVVALRASSVAYAPGRVDLTASGGFATPAHDITYSLGALSQLELLRELHEEVSGSTCGPLRTVAVFRNFSRGGQPDVLCAGRLKENLSDLAANDEVANITSLGQADSSEKFAAAILYALSLGPPTTNLQLLATLVTSPTQYPIATEAIHTLFV